MSKTFADAQLAKCDIITLESELLLLDDYGIDCKVKDNQMDRDELGGLIWLAESGCLTYKEDCKVGKLLNKHILIQLCDTEVDTSCDKYISCDTIDATDNISGDCVLPKISITIS